MPGIRFASALLTVVLLGSSLASAQRDTRKPGLADPVKVDARTEAVIKSALKYLASQQLPNGSWIGVTNRERQYPIAITSYALMAFLSAGHLPGEGEYGNHVTKGVKFLLDSITEDGLIGNAGSGQYMYFHGMATFVLAEVYGQSAEATLRSKLASLVKIILSSQNPDGGWRYRPFVRDADISVTVIQVVALRAAKNAGLDIPQKTLDEAVRYVSSCYRKDLGGFAYQPGRDVGFARTAAAIYSLQVCGKYDDPRIKAGSKYLFANFRPGTRWFTYGNFYAAPAQYMIGGKTWQNWYTRMKTLLLKHVDQKTDGTASWDLTLDRSGGIGPVYTTSVYTMILAMPYHYIPLYQR